MEGGSQAGVEGVGESGALRRAAIGPSPIETDRQKLTVARSG